MQAQRISVSIHDYLPYIGGTEDAQEIKIVTGPAVDGYGDYRVLHIGNSVDIFLSPKRLEQLRDKITDYLLAELDAAREEKAEREREDGPWAPGAGDVEVLRG